MQVTTAQAHAGVPARRSTTINDRTGIRSRTTVKWLELVVSSHQQDENLVVRVHPVRRGDRLPCFGISLDQRWLSSSEGTLTVFDTVAAATRFLNLLNLDAPTADTRGEVRLSASDPFQCFRLDAQGLAVCTRCRPEGRTPAPATTDDVFSDERW
jgi:hypothetical protein